jgi:hypothetical protein
MPPARPTSTKPPRPQTSTGPPYSRHTASYPASASAPDLRRSQQRLPQPPAFRPVAEPASYVVAQRNCEMGIRLAMGAQTLDENTQQQHTEPGLRQRPRDNVVAILATGCSGFGECTTSRTAAAIVPGSPVVRTTNTIAESNPSFLYCA